MTDDQHQEGTPQGGGRWNPLPQGDYDDGATAFVKLPEGGIDALLSGDSPLAAPGHGYVPPRITAAPGTGDPTATGTWTTPAGGAQWPDPNATGPAHTTDADDRFTYQPGATQHWTFEEPPAPAAPGHDVTGQWSIPVAGGDLPDESGEFTTSSLVEQWGGTPPATLPGGAPAPWATDGAGLSWGQPADPGTTAGPGEPLPGRHPGAHPADPAPAPAPDGYVPEEPYGPGRVGHTENGHARHGHGEHGHAEHGHVDAGRPGTGDAGIGHGDTGHQGTGHTDPGHTDPGHQSAGHPDTRRPDPGHPDAGQADAGPGEAPDAAAAQSAPAGHGAPAPLRTESGADPEADAHGPDEAPERPAEGPADHEQPADPADARRAATAAATAAAGGRPGPAATPAPGIPAPAASPAPGTAPVTPADPAHDHEAAVAEHPADAAEPAAVGDAAEDAAEGATEGDAEDPAAAPYPPHDDHPLASYVLRVNSADRPVTDAWVGESLLYVLRERLGLAGAKDGCSQGECGACNVQVDGRLVASCLVPAVTAAGSEVRTVEGLAADGQPSDVQRALARCGAVQCGFCVPGMAMTLHDLLEGNPAPTELETRQALCGNLCRCSGYRGVLEAVQEVVAEREASHAGPGSDADEARIPHQAGPGSGGVNPSAFEAPGAFAAPRTAPGGPGDPRGPYGEPQGPYGDAPDAYGDTPDAYGDTPGAYGDTPGPYGTPGPHDQHYGQDGGQA